MTKPVSAMDETELLDYIATLGIQRNNELLGNDRAYSDGSIAAIDSNIREAKVFLRKFQNLE